VFGIIDEECRGKKTLLLGEEIWVEKQRAFGGREEEERIIYGRGG